MKDGKLFLFLFFIPLFAFSQNLSQKKDVEFILILKQPDEVKKEEKLKKKTVEPLKIFSLEKRPYKIAISRNSEYLSLATKKGFLLVYDLKKMKLSFEKEISHAPLYALDSHPQEEKIVIGDRDGVIEIFNLKEKKIEKTIYELKAPISDVKFSSDGTVIGVAHFGGSVSFYDPISEELLLEINPHKDSIYSLALDKKSSYLVTTSRDKTVRISSLQKKKILQTFKDHKAFVLSCSFSQNDKFLATGAADGQIIIYKKENKIWRKPYFQWICGNWVTSLKFFGNYLYAASRDGKIRIFDYKNKSLLAVIDTEEPIINIDINKEYIAVASPTSVKIYSNQKAVE